MSEASLFSQPQRQSPRAIVLILLKYTRIVVRQLWPILLIILINPRSDKGMLITGLAFAIVIISLVYSIIAYTRFYYSIQKNEVVVRSGVLRKKLLNVPFDRIQSVDFKRNVVHQLLNVVSVQIDTAGSRGSELEIDAIDLEKAEAFRETIMAYKRARQAEAQESIDLPESIPAEPVKPELILSLSATDLIKVGISENHLRTAAIIFAFFVGLADDLEQILNLNVYDTVGESAQGILGLIATLLVIPFFIAVSFFITLVRTVFRYYGLKFWREEKRFKVVSGLFTRNEKTIQQSKIQLIRWVTNPVKRLFGIFQLNIYQAASVESNENKSLAIPGCYQAQVDRTLDMVVPEFREADFSAHRMHPAIVWLMVFLFGFLPALGFGLLAWWNDGVLQWLLVLIFPLAVWMGILYQRKRRFKAHPDFMFSESGIFGNTYKLIEAHKVQGVELTSSPMQRRRGLSTLHIYTAGGSMTFPYLDEKLALQARDYLLYKVEIDHKSWM